MDARIEGQLGGVVHTIPTRGNSPPPLARNRPGRPNEPRATTAPGGCRRRCSTRTATAPSSTGASRTAATPSPTFKPPPSGAAGANLRRVGHAPSAIAPAAQRGPAHARACDHGRGDSPRVRRISATATGADPTPRIPATPRRRPATSGMPSEPPAARDTRVHRDRSTIDPVVTPAPGAGRSATGGTPSRERCDAATAYDGRRADRRREPRACRVRQQCKPCGIPAEHVPTGPPAASRPLDLEHRTGPDHDVEPGGRRRRRPVRAHGIARRGQVDLRRHLRLHGGVAREPHADGPDRALRAARSGEHQSGGRARAGQERRAVRDEERERPLVLHHRERHRRRLVRTWARHSPGRQQRRVPARRWARHRGHAPANWRCVAA